MPKADEVQAVHDLLFKNPKLKVFAVVDGANAPELTRRLAEWKPERSECLFAGQLEPELAEAAPHIVELDADDDPMLLWLLERGWGRGWCIFVRAEIDLKSVRRHLRTFLRVRSPDDEFVFFRYYDPRVFRDYLPSCNAEEAQTVFGALESYWMEAEDGISIHAARKNGTGVQLSTHSIGAHD
tara:strand:+ start:1356 stop:1904 length:549 start_codon:yes stop_codon:yes gene_type:complete